MRNLRRYRLLTIIGVFTALLCAQVAVAADPADPAELGAFSSQIRELTERVGPSIVQIHTSSFGQLVGDPRAGAAIYGKQMGIGSGIILDKDGYIITNAHVVHGARRIQVMLSPSLGKDQSASIVKARGKMVGAQLLGVDFETDLAVLKINEKNLPALSLADSDELFQGQLVFAIGSPLGLSNSVSMGVVSAVARQLENDSPMIYCQHDAAVNPGNSGGALIDVHGNVVGVNTLIFSQSGGFEGLSFAAPSNIVRAVYEQLRTNGRVRRGVIGANAQTIDPWMAEALDLPQNWGVIISDVYPNGPAADAKLQAGDIIRALDGKTMENGRQFDVNLYGKKIDRKVSLEIIRDGRTMTKKVKVVERVEPDTRFLSMVSPERNLIRRLGILALDLNQDTKPMLPQLRGTLGVVVAGVAADAMVFGDPFRPGDVIYSVNKQEVVDLKSLRKLVKEIGYGKPAVIHLERGGKLVYVTMELE